MTGYPITGASRKKTLENAKKHYNK
jgi:hypothetical protein